MEIYHDKEYGYTIRTLGPIEITNQHNRWTWAETALFNFISFEWSVHEQKYRDYYGNIGFNIDFEWKIDPGIQVQLSGFWITFTLSIRKKEDFFGRLLDDIKE